MNAESVGKGQDFGIGSVLVSVCSLSGIDLGSSNIDLNMLESVQVTNWTVNNGLRQWREVVMTGPSAR